jgi:hypothetical protein
LVSHLVTFKWRNAGSARGSDLTKICPNLRSSSSDELLPTHEGSDLPATCSACKWSTVGGQGHQQSAGRPLEGQRNPRVHCAFPTLTSVNSAEVPLLDSLTEGFDKLEKDHIKLTMAIGISSYLMCPLRHCPVWMSSWGTFVPTIGRMSRDEPHQKVITCTDGADTKCCSRSTIGIVTVNKSSCIERPLAITTVKNRHQQRGFLELPGRHDIHPHGRKDSLALKPRGGALKHDVQFTYSVPRGKIYSHG